MTDTEIDYTKVFVEIGLDDSEDFMTDYMIDWCYDNNLKWNKDWLWEYATSSAKERDVIFSFSDPKNATMFSLKWTK